MMVSLENTFTSVVVNLTSYLFEQGSMILQLHFSPSPSRDRPREQYRVVLIAPLELGLGFRVLGFRA